jgi:hypothetical protein
LDKKEALEEKYEIQHKEFRAFWAENPDLHRKGVEAATRYAYESDGITWDDLADLSEHVRNLHARDLKFLEDKERVKRYLGEVDPEVGKGLAEKVIEEQGLSDEEEEDLVGKGSVIWGR